MGDTPTFVDDAPGWNLEAHYCEGFAGNAEVEIRSKRADCSFIPADTFWGKNIEILRAPMSLSWPTWWVFYRIRARVVHGVLVPLWLFTCMWYFKGTAGTRRMIGQIHYMVLVQWVVGLASSFKDERWCKCWESSFNTKPCLSQHWLAQYHKCERRRDW